MPEILDDIAYLSQEIGPRPAGKEEEQQAALYIADQFKTRVGLRAQVEDFSCNANAELVSVILFGLPIVFSILAMIRNIFVIPTILVALLCAVLYVLELRNRPILSRAMQRGISQNVIAKYRPEGVRGKRTRKIVVVANYDSGKIQQELALGNGLGILQKVTSLALLLIPVVWIIRAIVALGATGTTLVVWNVIVALLMLLALVPIVLFIIHTTAQYNEAANSNAAGVAALIELADRINNSFIEGDDEAEIHGEDAAREEGLVPEGADIEYAVETPAEPEQTEEERLMDAKAAIAALTGKPLREYAPSPKQEAAEASQVSYEEQETPEPPYVPEQQQPVASAPEEEISAPEEEASVEQEELAAMEEPADQAQYAPQPTVQTVGTPIPDWYRKAQEKADKSHQDEKPVRRSRYASALDDAVASSRAFFDAANRSTGREEAFFEERFSNGIVEVPAPMAAAPEAPAPVAEPEQEAPIQATPAPEPQAYDEPVESEPEVQEQQLAADFMVEQPQMPQAKDEEQTAPIPTVVMDEEEYIPGATRAMAPIDVNALRASIAADSSQQAVRDLQAKPSREVEPARRRDVDRIVYDGTGEIPEPIGVNSSLDLPELDSSLPPISELHKQRAPLATESDPSLSSQIPRINLDAFGVSTTGNAQPLDNKRAALRNMLPSMSGSISVEPGLQQPEGNSTVSLTGSFASIGATGTGSVGSVGDELVEGLAPEDVYIDDADDSFTETTMTESGAYAGPGYMEMPESRESRFFGRFRKKDKKKAAETTAQEWLDVHDDFNPTEVGAARGGWESFNNDDQGRVRSNRRNDADPFYDDDDWNGGAFSKIREVMPGNADADDGAEDMDVEAAPKRRRTNTDVAEAHAIAREIDSVEGFYAKKMELEVWFVALGSELAGNGGMKAFLDEHASDLRGSVVINLDSLGCGDFVYLESEGAVLQKSPSSRMRRYAKKAQEACGVEIGDATVNWRDSAAAVAMKRGFQAITLAGVEGSKPAKMGQGDDVVEDIDVNALYDRVDFAEAMVRSI